MAIGDWGLSIGPNPQSPIPNPQSPIPKIEFLSFQIIIFKINKIIGNLKQINLFKKNK